MHCRLCNASHASCGPDGTAVSPVTVTDLPMKGRNAMPELKIYTYTLNGNPVTVKLSPEDAKTLGAVEVKPKPGATLPAAPVDEKTRPDVHTAARTVPNKGR